MSADDGDGAGAYDGSNTTGFVSPASDSLEGPIDLSHILDLRRPHRYPVRVLGEALIERGIYPGDVRKRQLQAAGLDVRIRSASRRWCPVPGQ